MTKELFTIDDYKQAIKREQRLRSTAYPKALNKLKKRNSTKEEFNMLLMLQVMQDRLLNYAFEIVVHTPSPGSINPDFIQEIASELIRELKMRKKCYPRWVNFYELIDQADADYEIQVWESLTRWFLKEYQNLDELPTKRRKKTIKAIAETDQEQKQHLDAIKNEITKL